MTRTLHILLVSGALMMSGCYVTGQAQIEYGQPSQVHVRSAPPPVRAPVAVRPAQPQTNSVWVAGHWDWQNRWVWVDGRWETPRPGYVWTDPVAVNTSGGYNYHPGHWRRANTPPPAQYVQPNVVHVSARPTGTYATRPTVHANTHPQHVAPRHVSPGHVTPNTVHVAGQAGTPSGRVVAQPGVRPVTVNQPTTRVVTQPPNTVPGSRPATTVTVTPTRPGVSGTVVARPGAVAPTGRPATVVAQPGVVAPTGRPATVVARPGTVAPVARPGAVVAQPGRPAVAAGAVVAQPGRPGATVAGNVAQVGTARPSCRLNTTRAPRGGYITLQGIRIGEATVIRIGGRIGAVSARNSGQVRVQVPANSNGGAVSATVAGQNVSCGMLNII